MFVRCSPSAFMALTSRHVDQNAAMQYVRQLLSNPPASLPESGLKCLLMLLNHQDANLTVKEKYKLVVGYIAAITTCNCTAETGLKEGTKRSQFAGLFL